MKTPRALVILAEGAEEMEVTIAVDVLRRGGVEVVLAGLDGASPVVCSRKVRLLPDCALGEISGSFDVVVLPGGAEGARRLGASAAVGEILLKREAAGELCAAICAAPGTFEKHGVFRGRALTGHPSVHEVLKTHGRLEKAAVVVDGALITSQGPGTAFEFALAIVARLCGDEKAREVRAPMMLDAQGVHSL